ncbi:MAG: glycosyl transferase family 1, partial [Phenylobacterium sp.]|nr:glycosyl transferase family 1 [Phenylobacterium sp.]
MSSPGATLRNPLRAWLTGLRRWRLRRRQRRALAASAIFDAQWYRSAYPDAAGADPVDHYLACADGRRPSPWFDAAWYVTRYPDVVRSGINPLAHYILYGAAEGRNPNAQFASHWYLDNHPDAAAGATPLDHYVRTGGAQRLDPSPAFDAQWYAATHMAGDAGGLDPLAHFLLIGAAAGARPHGLRREHPGEPVEAARLETFKALQSASGQILVVLFATAHGGDLAAHVRPMVEALAGDGVQVVLLVETDVPFAPQPDLTACLAAGYVREPGGFRPAALAHLMRAEPLLFSGEMLWLVSDELAGPVGEGALDELVARLRRSTADVVAGMAHSARTRSPDSRFLVLKRRALAYGPVHAFFAAITQRGSDAEAASADFE